MRENRQITIYKQIEGLVYILFISTIVTVVADTCFKRDFSGIDLKYAKFNKNCVAVELRGIDELEGIYCVHPNTTLFTFFNDLDLCKDWPCDLNVLTFSLRDGTLISLENGQVMIGEMSATKKLALGIPLDINNVSYQDLILVPGIKEVTAKRIIEMREKKGKFSSMSELLAIRGIKEKRLADIKRYLQIREP
ncbi:MAG: helix-hairpin-helix domain-containing protein [Syntrophales bacterium]|nr:helix-hairpin-helix domain-containing protein [Syntrophales bacterium]